MVFVTVFASASEDSASLVPIMSCTCKSKEARCGHQKMVLEQQSLIGECMRRKVEMPLESTSTVPFGIVTSKFLDEPDRTLLRDLAVVFVRGGSTSTPVHGHMTFRPLWVRIDNAGGQAPRVVRCMCRNGSRACRHKSYVTNHLSGVSGSEGALLRHQEHVRGSVSERIFICKGGAINVGRRHRMPDLPVPDAMRFQPGRPIFLRFSTEKQQPQAQVLLEGQAHRAPSADPGEHGGDADC